MKLNQDYVKRLKELKDPQFDRYSIRGKKILNIPDISRGMLYENITKINFISLYTYIQIGLFNEGLIDEKWKADIDKVKWFLENRGDLFGVISANEYNELKIFTNSLYLKIRSPYVTEYMDMFYTDLIEKYGDLIVYNDVDDLYLKIDKVSFQSKEWITELKDFKHDVEFINYFYAEELKKYIEQEESGQINTKGFRDENKKQNLLSIIKREIRRRKLDNLGI
jgi:hypothetical protein